MATICKTCEMGYCNNKDPNCKHECHINKEDLQSTEKDYKYDLCKACLIQCEDKGPKVFMCTDFKLNPKLQITDTNRKETVCLGDLTCEVRLSYYCETHETNHFIDLDKGDDAEIVFHASDCDCGCIN